MGFLCFGEFGIAVFSHYISDEVVVMKISMVEFLGNVFMELLFVLSEFSHVSEDDDFFCFWYGELNEKFYSCGHGLISCIIAMVVGGAVLDSMEDGSSSWEDGGVLEVFYDNLWGISEEGSGDIDREDVVDLIGFEEWVGEDVVLGEVVELVFLWSFWNLGEGIFIVFFESVGEAWVFGFFFEGFELGVVSIEYEVLCMESEMEFLVSVLFEALKVFYMVGGDVEYDSDEGFCYGHEVLHFSGAIDSVFEDEVLWVVRISEEFSHLKE